MCETHNPKNQSAESETMGKSRNLLLMIALCVILSIGALACASPTVADPAPTEVPTPTPEPISLPFEGTGDLLTPIFDLRKGIVVLTLRHEGQANFIVQIIGEDSDSTELSVNTIGDYSGVRAHQVQAEPLLGLQTGSYRIQVQADGPWQILLEQPIFPEGEAPPLELDGTGDMVEGPILLPRGTTPVQINHQGQANFIVEVYSVDGMRRELLVNTIGNYDGSLALRAQENPLFGLEPGTHMVVVRADGPWTIRFGE
jgi:hypothetical protein